MFLFLEYKQTESGKHPPGYGDKAFTVVNPFEDN